MKRANGTGSVRYLGKNRRRPYAAVITVESYYTEDKLVQVRKAIGYYAKKADAVKALDKYYMNPYDLTMTFKDVYEMWGKTYYPNVSKSVVNARENAYKRSAMLYDKLMGEIKLKDLEECMESLDTTEGNIKRLKELWSMMFEYAIKHEFATVNYARYLEIKNPEVKIVRTIFTPEEIQKLWDDGSKMSHLILIGIYSGWRPSELLTMTIKEEYMEGGMKTKAGKRIVPIHSKIKPIMSDYTTYSGYDKYRRAFVHHMEVLGMHHYPHDTRHTFSTLCAEYDVNASVRDLLMGHAQKTIGDQVYTHRSLENLKKEIEKIV